MKKVIIAILNICVIIIVLTTSIYAWYNGYFGLRTTDDIYLSSNSAYFDSGEGTETNPYIIANARHFYNLAWLQDLGFFDDANPDTLDKKEPFYFKLKDGIEEIDMSTLTINGKQSPIPPIGIDAHPFISNFEGSGYTINNLIIDVNFDVSKGYLQPDQAILDQHSETINAGIIKTTAVGTFGIIGTPRAAGSTEEKKEFVQNFYLDNTVIKSSIQATVGVVAGVVNSNIRQIGVHYSSLQFNGANPLSGQKMSDYGLIGRYDADSGNWADRAGMVENFKFNASTISKVTSSIKSGVDYNATYGNHGDYKAEIFNLIGELKLTTISASVNTGFERTYEYDGQTYNYKAPNPLIAIQFQDGFSNSGKTLRSDRHLRFHADGKGIIFFAVAGNGSVKTIEVYKSKDDPNPNFTSVNGAFNISTISGFDKLNTTISSTAVQHELTWGSIEITEPGDYVFASQGGNAYLAYMHFIIANNQGNSGGANAAYTIDKIDFIYLDPSTNQFIPFDETYKPSSVAFEIISGTGNIYFRRNNDSGTNNKDVVLFYPNRTDSSLTFNYYTTGNKGVAVDQTCETLSGDIITGGSGGGGSGPVVSKYTVTFDSQGGSAVTSQTVNALGTVTEPAAPTKSGSTFGGWYKEAGCTNAWNFSTDKVSGNTTLYAKWIEGANSIYDDLVGRTDELIHNDDFNNYQATDTLPLHETWGAKPGVYYVLNKAVDASKLGVVLGAGNAVLKDDNDAGSVHLVVDFGTITSGTLEGYVETTFVNPGNSWTFFQLYGKNGGAEVVEIFGIRIDKDIMKYRITSAGTVTQPSGVSIPSANNNTYKIYYKLDMATGLITVQIGVNDGSMQAFVTDLDIQATEVVGFKLVTSDNGSKKQNVDNIAVVNNNSTLNQVALKAAPKMDVGESSLVLDGFSKKRLGYSRRISS